jgi:hypothetical protein
MLMKCGDVNNATKPMSLYSVWINRVLMEFFRQGDEEKRLNIPVSPFMDRETSNIASSQRGFIEIIVTPLFEAFNMYTPIPNIMETLLQNREHWSTQPKKASSMTLSNQNVSGSVKSNS